MLKDVDLSKMPHDCFQKSQKYPSHHMVPTANCCFVTLILTAAAFHVAQEGWDLSLETREEIELSEAAMAVAIALFLRLYAKAGGFTRRFPSAKGQTQKSKKSSKYKQCVRWWAKLVYLIPCALHGPRRLLALSIFSSFSSSASKCWAWKTKLRGYGQNLFGTFSVGSLTTSLKVF